MANPYIWRSYSHQKNVYNTVKLTEKDCCYQLYLWHDNLSVADDPYVKVIKTHIYGVNSSGNQAESGLRTTSRIESGNFPRASTLIQKDIYVDDCLSGENSWDMIIQTTDGLQLVLARGGFAGKGFAFDFSNDVVSVNVAGLKWHTKSDKISLETGNLNFSRKI